MNESMQKVTRRLKRWEGAVALAALLLAACSSDGPEPGPSAGPMQLTLETEEVTAATARIALACTGVDQYAWQLVAADGEIPDAETILRINPRLTPEQGHATLRIQYLDASTPYTLAVAALGGDGGTQTLVQTLDFTTPDADNILTITGIEKNALSFRIACSGEQYWKYAFLSYLDYLERKASPFWPYDSRFLSSNGEPLKGPQTLTFPLDEYTQILPGQTYILLVGECDAEGQFLYERREGGGGVGPEPLPASALPGDAYPDDDVLWSGFFCRRIIQAEVPDLTALTTGVEQARLTTRSVTFFLSPDEEAYGFTAGVLNEENYQKYKTQLGEEGMQYFTAYSMRFYTSPAELDFVGLEEGQYYLLVTTLGDENAFAQSFQTIPFRRSTPTRPAAQLLVTGIDAPEGETARGPYYCWFNVKAPNKDAVYGTYLTMDYDQYLNAVQFGTTAEQQIAAYIDQARFKEDAMAAINSDQGLNLCINAWEDSRYVLIAGVANDEEVLTASIGMNQTPPAEAEPRTESDLFTSLPGVWTIRGTGVQYQPETGQWLDYLRITARTTLALAPPLDDVPATLPEEVYQAYADANVSRTLADAYFRDFRQTGSTVAGKYRDRNRIVGCGMELAWGSAWGQMWSESALRTPWDLFSASDYNGSGNMDIYRDYGPKYFLHVAPGDRLTLQADSRTIGTVSGYDRQMLIFASANQPEADGTLLLHDEVAFPVDLAADGNTLTIRPIELEGKTYYFTLAKAGWGDGTYEILFRAKDVLTLSRGWSGEDGQTIVENLLPEPEPEHALRGRTATGRRATRTMPSHAVPAGWQPTAFTRHTVEYRADGAAPASARYGDGR